MLYSALPVPATAVAITSSIYVTFLVLDMHCKPSQSQALHRLEKPQIQGWLTSQHRCHPTMVTAVPSAELRLPSIPIRATP